MAEWFFRFLRRASRPIKPAPPAKSGSAAGSGVADGTASSEPAVTERPAQTPPQRKKTSTSKPEAKEKLLDDERSESVNAADNVSTSLS